MTESKPAREEVARVMFLSREEVRRLDQRATEEFGVPGIVLMENAGRGAGGVLRSLGASGRVVICCGRGNNGGDGLVMARHLDLMGVAVEVLMFARPEELSGDAAVNHQIVARSGIPMQHLALEAVDEAALRGSLAGTSWIIDALFGTGLKGPLRPPFDRIVEVMNASGVPIIAVDIPSGLDCDRGEPLGATVRARHTITFVAPKKGFANPGATAWTGEVHVVGIGAPRVLLEQFGIATAK